MITQSLELFQYEGIPIQVLGTPEDPHWIAKEVCQALNISNHRDALSRLDEDEKGVVVSDTPGGKQELLIVNEPGLWNLVIRSNKPEAKEFKRWLTHEVIPTIRRKGRYEIEKAGREHQRDQKVISLQEEIISLQKKLLEAKPLRDKTVGKRRMPKASEEIKHRAWQMRQDTDLTYKQIGQELGGYATNTVAEWVRDLRKERQEEV